MSTNAAGKRRTPEEVRKGRSTVVGAAIGFAIVMVALIVLAVVQGNFAIVGALVAVAGGGGAALWASTRDDGRDG